LLIKLKLIFKEGNVLDIDKLFKDKAFRNMDKNLLSSFKNLTENIKGKNFNETLDMIIKFSESMPKDRAISDNEKNAMISAILNSLNDDERNRFKTILNMIGDR